eukprot:2833467-Rhodomonas_salina.1
MYWTSHRMADGSTGRRVGQYRTARRLVPAMRRSKPASCSWYKAYAPSVPDTSLKHDCSTNCTGNTRSAAFDSQAEIKDVSSTKCPRRAGALRPRQTAPSSLALVQAHTLSQYRTPRSWHKSTGSLSTGHCHFSTAHGTAGTRA